MTQQLLAQQALQDWQADQSTPGHGSTVYHGRPLDIEALRFWAGFHARRQNALRAVAKGDGYVKLRQFVAECISLDMPMTAHAAEMQIVEKPYNSAGRE